MTSGPGNDRELGHAERELADRLSDLRPVPAPGFRGTLGRLLAAEDPGYGPRPPELTSAVFRWFVGGLLLIALGAMFAVGAL